MDDLTGDCPTIASQLSGVAEVVAGRYRIRARLGRGASKEVYLAYDELLDREVALAVVVGASSAAARARVAREARVTGRLGEHPNVITVHDTGEYNGVPYLVLRAMTGGSLADLLQRERPSIARVIRLGGEIAGALAHAHSLDVVHRDIKPDNVWLADDGSAALGDFGIAHLLGAERLTAEGVVVGTVRYLSPEQIRGEEIGPSSDLYALGITLYELVTGRPPFTAKDATQVLTQHLTSVPVPPSEHEPAIPDGLEQLILALLAKQPEQRPSSAAEVAAALAAMGATASANASVVGRQRGSTSASTPPRASARRLVSVLAARAEIADPEVLHAVLDRCAGVIEQHGGTVEGYFGNALVGIFGLTASHGDDALRATRAAVELRTETEELRLGLETGEVFLGAGVRGAMMATGAAITAAGRLAERAEPGHILLGDDIRRTIAADAQIDPASGRLLALALERPALLRPASTPFVGRSRELEELHAALARVSDERACRLVTVAGPPGIGKSRLTGEFLAAVADRATVVAGRCLAYGEGTTYRALADIVRAVGDEPGRRVEDLLSGDEQAVRGIMSAIGLAHEPVQPEETAWAVRRLFERLARDRPLVVAVEDVHWAAPPLLDLLDHVAALSSGAPILLVCLTRPELLDTRPQWAAPQPNRSVVMLDALADAQARELAEGLGAGELSARIARRAEGNPLFVEQLVAVDSGGEATGELPASIQAVLAARIDGLESGERTVLQQAAVEGRTFHAGALAATLAPAERGTLATRLVALARKGLIGADQPEFAGEDAFRFTHALIGEAAYAGLAKAARADLHALVAGWLEAQPSAADEVVAYHLERACLLLRELGRGGDRERALAERAAQRLEAASQTALARSDAQAASALLERAVALLGADGAARAALLPALGAALFEAGRREEATRILDEAIAQAPEPRVRARAQVEREFVRLETETSAGTEGVRRIADSALAVLEREADDRGRARVWSLRAQISYIAGRMSEADAAWRRAADYAADPRDERERFEILAWRANAAVFGPTPVPEAIARCRQFRAIVAASPVAEAWMINPLAVLHAMNGEFAVAETLLAEAHAILDGLGGMTANVSHLEAMVRMLMQQPGHAETALRADVDALATMGRTDALATTTAMLAQAVLAQGRIDEAAELCAAAARATAPDDVFTDVTRRGVQASVRALQGACAEALELARSALEIVAATDLLTLHGDAMLRCTEVTHECSPVSVRSEEESLRAAIVLYEKKGNVTAAARARRSLGTSQGSSSHGTEDQL